MIKVDVAGLTQDMRTSAPVVLLYVPVEEKCLPIWIGPAEADSIGLVLRGEAFSRPLTHDLLSMVIDGLGGRVDRLVITDQREGTYYARLFLARDQDVVAVDARPSDGIALALRAKAPIYVEDAVIAKVQDSLVSLSDLESHPSDPDSHQSDPDSGPADEESP